MRPALLCLSISAACARPQAPAGPAAAAPEPDPAAPATAPAPAETPEPPAEQADAPPALVLEEVAPADIPGFSDDALDEAIPALLRSCDKLLRRGGARPVGPGGLGGTVADWKPICRAARRLRAGDTAAARRFFTERFRAYLVTDRGDPGARYTGYYEASMKGARRRHGPYQWPIYRRPDELVMVHLADFHDSPRPRRVAGKVVGGRLRPYFTRKQIRRGALRGRGLELFWVTDPVDAFFAQVQGSAIVELPDGSQVRIGYAGKNGHRYTAIGRVLLREGEITREEMSMQAIRAWLDEHPDRVHELLDQNDAYVFFEEVSRPGAIGAQGGGLTARRSAAIDPDFLPLPAPPFVVTDVPDPSPAGQLRP